MLNVQIIICVLILCSLGLEVTEAAVPIAISPPSAINSGHNLSNKQSSPQHSSDTLSSDEQPADNHDGTEDKDGRVFFLVHV